MEKRLQRGPRRREVCNEMFAPTSYVTPETNEGTRNLLSHSGNWEKQRAFRFRSSHHLHRALSNDLNDLPTFEIIFASASSSMFCIILLSLRGSRWGPSLQSSNRITFGFEMFVLEGFVNYLILRCLLCFIFEPFGCHDNVSERVESQGVDRNCFIEPWAPDANTRLLRSLVTFDLPLASKAWCMHEL